MNFDNSVSKKKKKSKKTKLEEPVEDIVPKKKKKRHDIESPSSSHSKSGDMKFGRRKQKHEMNNNMSPVKELDNSFSSPTKELDKYLSSPKRLDKSFTSVESTPEGRKKKKRKSTLEEVNHSVKTEGNSENDDLSMLSEFQTPAKKKKMGESEKKELEENQKLINLVLEQVKPELTTYSARLASLNFEKIAENFEDRTAKDCEIQLNMLIDIIPKKKCLHQLLSETLEELPKERSTNNFGNFIHLNAQEIEEEIEKGILGNTKLTVAAAMWKNMSNEDKRAYAIKSKKVGKMEGQSSVDLYHLYLKKKDSKVLIKDARLKWTQLSEAKKIKFISKSAKIMKSVLEAREENDDEDAEHRKIKGPTKDEILLFLNHHEAPKSPYKLVSMFYYCKEIESSPGRNVLFDAIRTFNELSKEKQAEWTEKHKKAMKKFEKNLEEWKEKQDEITLFIYNISKNPPKSEKKKDAGKSPSKIGQKARQDRLKKIEMPIGKVTFVAEPSVPPLSPAELYARQVAKNTGEKLTLQMSKEKFSGLDKPTQATLSKKSEKIREVYVNGLLDYVDKMVIEQKKLFLGLKRIRYMKLLGEDIFEEKYPNEAYPVYIKPTKEKVVIKQDPDNMMDEEESCQEEMEEEEKEEEEEEDEESSPSPPKKKIRDYSSRKAEKASKSPSKKKSKKKHAAELDESQSSEDEPSYIY